MTARAFWTIGPGQGELRVETLPRPRADEALVRTLASGVSRGTESLVFAGRVPASQYAAMRCPFQAGDFPFPVKYGYSAVGIVEAGPPALIGRRVFCLHPHQDRFLAPAAMLHTVPETVPTRRAVLAANMETALNIAWDAAALPGERVLVIGAGVVGLLAAHLLARIPGVTLTAIDTDPGKARIAAALGLAFATPGEAPAEAELIVHASGSPDGLALALARAGFEARIIEASWFGDRVVPLPLGEAFHSRRLRLLSSQVGSIAATMRGRRSHAERLALALALLDDARLDALLDGPTPFADLPATMARLAASPGALCHLIAYDPSV
ncbi:zinc-dependent alcohol dehydrogenase [Elioraea tepidiphila]|jgi:NADPH:quinone reductase-like Zn-dependent oxidoreductase|uniref:zinc-dependent alcohol dehydrogenase n=1 Tax=Elioraea tepidiphila TaxID=457934 RepID=UPI000364B06A|nr:zinc-binding alcohol dehydrogenase [Elioraea tepidiphila]